MAFGSSGGDKNKRFSGGAIADINVTPLVDILLVLLIIFMVTAPTVFHGARLVPPDITPNDNKQEPQKDEKDTLIIDKKGTLKFRGSLLSKTQLRKIVKTDPQLRKTKELYLQASLDLDYGKVMEIIGLVRRAGIRKLGIVVETNELGLTPTPPPPKR